MPAHRPPDRTAALVTGSSSGIGRAVALRLHRAGHPVYAGARTPSDLADLAAAGPTPLRLDVTDEDSMTAAVKEITDRHGAVSTLVNCAGYGLSGTVEEEELAAVRRQFETNVFGLARLVQLVLPAMREQGHGTVVNVSSIFGRYAVPGGGYYHASKHAVEALSDALRLEVARFGVRVVLIEPGPTRTRFGQRYVAGLQHDQHDQHDQEDPGDEGPYGDFRRRGAEYYDAVFHGTRRSFAGRFVVEADDVARTVQRAVQARRPRARYPVGLLAATTLRMRRLLPDSLFDAFVRGQFPVP